MGLLQSEIRKADDEVSRLLRQYEKESRDVEQLQKESLSSFLLRLIGKHEDKLEQKQAEEINAKLAYDRAATNLENLIEEKNELASRISNLRSEERTYQSELKSRRVELSIQPSEPSGVRYIELENERKAIMAQVTEIEEALRAASRAKSTANKIEKSLDSAGGWATFDVFTKGGLITHMAKYSHIDDAEKGFHLLSSQIDELKNELADVDGLTSSGLTEISSGQRSIDFWFNNIFTSLSVRSQIKDNAAQITQLIKNLDSTESVLNKKLKEQESALGKNKRDEEELLLSIR
jgi:chromosome segregation ATPase